MGLIDKLFGREGTSARKITLKNPLVVSSPKIAFLNLVGDTAKKMVAADRGALGDLFSEVTESEREVPQCSVLMIYATLESDGHIKGRTESLREIIQAAGAPVVVIASENDPKAYIAAGHPSDIGKANLVMTLERRGERFPEFFAKLFALMFQGETMPMAWVKLAPQSPGDERENIPSTIFVAEISHIVFKR
jgi:hypothetical protein